MMENKHHTTDPLARGTFKQKFGFHSNLSDLSQFPFNQEQRVGILVNLIFNQISHPATNKDVPSSSSSRDLSRSSEVEKEITSSWRPKEPFQVLWIPGCSSRSCQIPLLLNTITSCDRLEGPVDATHPRMVMPK